VIVVADAAIAGAWASIQFNSIISIHFSDAQPGLDQINRRGLRPQSTKSEILSGCGIFAGREDSER
jgi:hypothetical protein